MCGFVEVLEKIKSSSSASVANKEFSEFNKYMHVVTNMDEELKETIKKANDYKKALVLVCGNSGDGKSHLIANLISQGIIDENEFDIYIDATSSDKKGMRANEKLKEKLFQFSDANIANDFEYKLIVAINLGVLNDFLKNCRDEYKTLENYINANSLFDNIPTWKSVELDQGIGVGPNYIINHVDFTEYRRYSLSDNGVGISFIKELLNRIVSDDNRNDIFTSFKSSCLACPYKTNCPTYYNYKFLMVEENRNFVSDLLTRTIVKYNLTPSIREINDFFYSCIVGNTFDAKKNLTASTERLIHFLYNLLLWNIFEAGSALSSLAMKEDILSTRACDSELIRLNLLPSFEKWLSDEAITKGDIYKQIEANIKYCTENHAVAYRKIENEIKRDVFKMYLRSCNYDYIIDKEDYEEFVRYLFAYNIGDLEECDDLIELTIDCFHKWSGRLLNQNSELINNAVIVSSGSENYCLYKIIELMFAVDPTMIEISSKNEYWKFTSNIRLGFSEKGSNQVYFVDIDYEQFRLMKKIKRGYQTTKTDRRGRVKFDSFVKAITSNGMDEVHVYSYKDAGKRFVIRKNHLGKYVFEEER